MQILNAFRRKNEYSSLIEPHSIVILLYFVQNRLEFVHQMFVILLILLLTLVKSFILLIKNLLLSSKQIMWIYGLLYGVFPFVLTNSWVSISSLCFALRLNSFVVTDWVWDHLLSLVIHFSFVVKDHFFVVLRVVAQQLFNELFFWGYL